MFSSHVLFLSLFVTAQSAPSFTYCDYDSVPSSTKVSELVPNQFHKICPGMYDNKPLGQPRCGDGTNFAFYFIRPAQKFANDNKIMIEFQGGGACWNGDVCDEMAGYLTFPQTYDNFIGLSCTEVNAAVNNNNNPLSVLCAQSIGDTNLREYNSLTIPYCTQDVHIGDSIMNYSDDDDHNDDDGSSTIRHVGGHNMMQTLQWMFANFPNPSHIFLTGCSAGGTALPIAYDLINKNYNSNFKLGVRSVQISVISDSPVYLTPTSFLKYGYANWNPDTILNLVNFDPTEFIEKEDYSTILWNHVLNRGSNKDQWGLISHTYDPVAVAYYEVMSYAENGDNGENNNDDNDDFTSLWWNKFSDSLDTIQGRHNNVKSFFIDDEGHCSFGLYYALQSNGFTDWAQNILHERIIFGKNRPSFLLFTSAILLGISLGAAIILAKKKRMPIDLDDVILLNDKMKIRSSFCLQTDSIINFLLHFRSFPVTTIFAFIMTFYFVSMMIVGGLTHPIYNPSLGPSAEILSSFGINNPSLIVYNNEYWRLVTSAFLCSGIFTYLLFLNCLIKYVRYIEIRLNDPKIFMIVCSSIILGSNLLYAFTTSGSTCTGMALIFGLNGFGVTMGNRVPITNGDNDENFQLMPWGTNLFFLLLICFFPFNSWLTIFYAIFIGSLISPRLFFCDYTISDENENTDAEITLSKANKKIAWKALNLLIIFYSILFGSLVTRITKPNLNYKYPYLTGCELVYSTHVTDLIGNYADQLNGEKRFLNEDEEEKGDDDNENMCAQLCVPHIVYRPILWSINRYTSYSVEHGLCEDIGYDNHIADKTFNRFTFTLDVDLYYFSDYNE